MGWDTAFGVSPGSACLFPKSQKGHGSHRFHSTAATPAPCAAAAGLGSAAGCTSSARAVGTPRSPRSSQGGHGGGEGLEMLQCWLGSTPKPSSFTVGRRRAPSTLCNLPWAAGKHPGDLSPPAGFCPRCGEHRPGSCLQQGAGLHPASSGKVLEAPRSPAATPSRCWKAAASGPPEKDGVTRVFSTHPAVWGGWGHPWAKPVRALETVDGGGGFGAA